MVQALLTAPLVDEIGGTLNVLFLTEARAYLRAFRELVRLRPLLREVFTLIGRLDAAQSQLCLGARPGWFVPRLTERGRPLSVTDLVHPLLEEAVSNSWTSNGGGVVITGSNMSGKSTFLRALGLCVVLAQALLAVPALGCVGGHYRVRVLRSAEDDLLARKSYHLDEAQAVLRIVTSAQDSLPALWILDELFRGTNTTERVAAGASVVRFLVRQGSPVVVATHDLALAALLEDTLERLIFGTASRKTDSYSTTNSCPAPPAPRTRSRSWRTSDTHPRSLPMPDSW